MFLKYFAPKPKGLGVQDKNYKIERVKHVD